MSKPSKTKTKNFKYKEALFAAEEGAVYSLFLRIASLDNEFFHQFFDGKIRYLKKQICISFQQRASEN